MLKPPMKGLRWGISPWNNRSEILVLSTASSDAAAARRHFANKCKPQQRRQWGGSRPAAGALLPFFAQSASGKYVWFLASRGGGFGLPACRRPAPTPGKDCGRGDIKRPLCCT